MTEFASLADALLPAILKAGRIVMSHFREGVAVTTKIGGSPVTAADQEAEACLLEALEVAAPGVRVIAEEMMAGRGAAARCEGRFFLVDPLDGTRGFAQGIEQFTINIGLIEDRVPRFGAIYAPALSSLFLTLGEATAVSATVAASSHVSRLADLQAKRIHSKPVSDGTPLRVFTSRSQADALEVWLARLGIGEVSTFFMPSSLKFCRVAEGAADVYPRFGPTSEWDTAAGHAIVNAAGGEVTRADGAPLLYGKHEDGFLNPPFIAAARRMESLFVSEPVPMPSDDA